MASNELNLALKIKADLNEALNQFKALEKQLQANAASGEKFGAESAAMASGLGGVGREAEQAATKLGKTRAGLESISQQLGEVKRQAIGLFAAHFALGNLKDASDEFNNLQARIQLVSGSNREAQGTFSALMRIANETGTQFSAAAELYARVFRSLGSGANSGEILRFTETVSKAMAVSGAGAQEAQAAIVQLSQGMAAGALRGEEFNSVAEQAPILLELLQKSLGKTRGELRKLAEEGKLTTDVIMQAVAEGADSIAEQYAQMPMTIGKAINQLSNAWLAFVGGFQGTSAAVAAAISTIAEHLGLLSNIGFAAAAVALSRYLNGLSAVTKIKAGWTALTAAVTAATNVETAAIGRQTLAYNALTVAKTAASRAGAGLLALAGGPLGLAITGVMGLAAAYFYLKGQEEQAEQQFNQTLSTLDANLDKTEALVEARRRLGQFGGFGEQVQQLNINTESLKEAQAELDKLIAKRDLLEQQALSDGFGGGLFDNEALARTNEHIDELQPKIEAMSRQTAELADITQVQLALAYDAAMEAGGLLAEKLNEIGDPQHPEAIKLLTEEIKRNEAEALAMKSEVEQISQRLRQDLSTASTTAVERLEAMRAKFVQIAAQAGISGNAVQGFINQINEAIGLQQELERVKSAKAGADELENLRKRGRQSGMTAAERNRDNVLHNANWSDEQKKEALALYQTIEENEKKLKARQEADRQAKSAAAKARRQEAAEAAKSAREAKRTAEEATERVQQLNIEYLRLTGQQAKADLLDMQSRYNQMMKLFTAAGNQEGISLVKKMLPLEETKLQLKAIEDEVEKANRAMSAKEQSIQAQVQTGLISHFEGQQQLKNTYLEMIADIEKHLPALEKLSTLPTEQGEAASLMLQKLKNQVEELKNAGDDLTRAFEDGFQSGLEEALLGLARGTMSLSEAVKHLALTVIDSMAQIAAQELSKQTTSWVMSAVGAVAGGVAAATGGYISGPGTGTSDSILARLSNGEFVVKAASVQKYGVGFLHALNRGQLKRFATGGLVSAPAAPNFHTPDLTAEMKNGTAGQTVAAVSPVNIRQTLAVDSAELFTSGINTVAGERAVLTVIRANKQTLKQELT